MGRLHEVTPLLTMKYPLLLLAVMAATFGRAEEPSIPSAAIQSRYSNDKSAGDGYAVCLDDAIGNLQRSLNARNALRAASVMDNPRQELDELNLAYLKMLKSMLGKLRTEVDEAIKAWNAGPCGRRILELNKVVSRDASLETLIAMKKRLADLKLQENKSEDMMRAILRLEESISKRETELVQMPQKP